MSAKVRNLLEGVQQLASVLDDALILLDANNPYDDASNKVSATALPSSLFEQCLELCRDGAVGCVEPIRTIHHLSSTGGTLIAKCIAAMPNVLVLNEIDPLSTLDYNSDKPKFTPTDMLSLVRQGNQNVSSDLLQKLFIQNLQLLHDECALIGKRLVLRDHSHSHYLVGPKIANRPSLLDMVKNEFQTRSVVTVRDPVDSYLSVINNEWLHFQPGNFDEYCRRYNVFLDTYDEVQIIKYEDFVASPSEIMNKLCDLLDLNYTDNFIDTFDAFVFSGDSGRKGSVIEPRERRELPPNFLKEAYDSNTYTRLAKRLNYQNVGSL